MSASIRRSFVLPLALVALALGTAGPTRADEAGVRRLAAALGRIDDAPEPMSAMFRELEALEGLRLTGADEPAIRAQLADRESFLPIADALREMTVQGGVVRMRLERPVVLALRRGVVALGADVSLRIRSGAQPGELTVDQTRGIKVGRTASLTLPLRRLEVRIEDGKRVGRAEVMLGFIPKTLTFDAPSADPAPTPGLVGGLPST